MSIPDLGAPAQPQPQPQPQPSDSQPPRNWQQWQGRNQFYCDGRVMGGPAEGVRTLWVTIILVIVPSVVFAVLPARDFDRLGYWVLPVGLGLFALTLFFLCATGFSDPGVVPRSTDKSREIDSLNFRKPPRQQDVLGAGQVYALKYCDTCSIIRPPRSIHCSICNNCVEVFDHHCPWVGNCVGKRNYRQFIGFIYSTTCYSVFMIAICITRLKKMTDEKDGDFVETLKTDPSPLILIVYCIPAFGFVIAMSVFHTYLICRGETTNESLKRLFPFGSPFSRGVCGNFQRAVCSVPSESHVKPRAVVSTLASATAAHGGRPTRTPSYSVAAYGGASAGGPGYGAPSEPYHQGGSIAMAALGPNGNGNGDDDDDTVVPAPLQPVVAVMNERRVVFLDHQQMDAHARAKNADRFAAVPVAASAPVASSSAAVSANGAPAVAVAISSPSAAPAAAQPPAETDDLSYRPTRFAAEDAAAAAAAANAASASPAAAAAVAGAPQPQPLLHRRSTVELPVTPTAEVLALQAPAALPAMTTLAPPSSSVAFGPAAPTGAAVALPPLGYSAPLPSAPPSLPPMQPLR